MEKNGIIELDGMEFRAFHGCLDSEKENGNTFTVDFRGMTDMSKAASDDRLEDTADYGILYRIIAGEMEGQTSCTRSRVQVSRTLMYFKLRKQIDILFFVQLVHFLYGEF